MYRTKIYYKDENYTVTLEELNEELFIHVKFKKFSKTILLDALKVWAEIKAKCYWLGYEHIYTYTKDDRMSRLFPGAHEVTEFEDDRLGKYKVLQWELN